MLQSTFVHLPGIGEATESALWQEGIRSWQELEEAAEEIFSAKKALSCLTALEESRVALDAGELNYFQSKLGSRHAWRLLPHCEDAMAYLDIETTGLGFPPASHSTTVAVSFCGELFVEHEEKKKALLFERLHDEAKMWVTFNGQCFDLPFLRQELDLEFLQPHVDLRVWLKNLGFKGGLKKIQNEIPEIPSRSSMDIDGFDAVRLWRMHKRGLSGALDTLMTYNAEDTVVLEHLIAHAWQLQTELLGDVPYRLPVRAPAKPPLIGTCIHEHVYEMLRGRATWELPLDW